MIDMSEHTESAALISRLPFEIRCLIFEEVLGGERSFDIANNLSNQSSEDQPESDSTGAQPLQTIKIGLSGQLLRVCKLWNVECSPILYRHRSFWIKGEDVPDLVSRTIGSHSVQFIEKLSIGSQDFGHTEAMIMYPSLLLRMSSLKRFDFCPTVSAKSIEGCQAVTFHWKCTTLIPCRKHIMQTKEHVLRFAAKVISTHQILKVLVGSRKAILPVYSLIMDNLERYEEVAADRYSNWDTITRETLEDIREKLVKTEAGWMEDRAAFSTRQAF